jgi:hypothetical protein
MQLQAVLGGAQAGTRDLVAKGLSKIEINRFDLI